MNNKKYETNYEVPSLGRKDLRRFAKVIRISLGGESICFPVVELLETLGEMGIYYDIVDRSQWNKIFGANEHAEYDLSTHIISIREDVYEGAVKGLGRDRFTIAHEIAHALLLDDKHIKLAKTRGKTSISLWQNPEWQADCLAGELLVPCDLCREMSITEIAEKCKVSLDAAIYQKSKF